ncbi:hypothetical protein [Brevibacillus laterosporus]|uniref:Uncharacterized protein n=1 Tax=Brevibacillus laterosporus TaxID=1465 RepID=A0AAP3DKL8_BRELA|nr:hypothetical protein [Brevibacillus laterosporus]MCR8981635.1 hypothetical protein [Brevibacillus laterosporus]MCZ0808790.1 hypothetical protein [Brevibacillus laterosporus]MCZ0827237.1 hypothetical protein [Brevibacillus laterosporus]MCZ0850993.1 hypothetical protein [Brevibacillus laterosporus]
MGAEWDAFEERVKSELSFWRMVLEAHPGFDGRCIGACFSEISKDEAVLRRINKFNVDHKKQNHMQPDLKST